MLASDGQQIVDGKKDHANREPSAGEPVDREEERAIGEGGPEKSGADEEENERREGENEHGLAPRPLVESDPDGDVDGEAEGIFHGCGDAVTIQKEGGQRRTRSTGSGDRREVGCRRLFFRVSLFS